MRYIGIDPGSEPAACVLNNEGQIENIFLCKKYDGEFNWECLEDKLHDALEYRSPYTCIVEDVHSVHKSSAKANFSFGGGVQGSKSHTASTLKALGVEEPYYHKVAPKVWQKLLWKKEDKVKGDNKATSLNCAKRILGNKWKDETFYPTQRSYTVNHNLVDAFLIARYAYEINN